MSEDYINLNFDKIINNENIIENRNSTFDATKKEFIDKNVKNLKASLKYNNNFILIENEYNLDYSI